MKKLPIGLSDFKELIQEKYYYIDKTNLISEVIDNSAKIVLLPRPRRFGKTLNLTMTKYFFDVEEDNRELFNNLNMACFISSLHFFNLKFHRSMDFSP